MMNNKMKIENLITENRRVVEAVAKQYKNRGLTMEQLIEEGNKGLVKADERFDPSKGFKFLSYAVWWIRQSILEALAATENGEPMDQWHPVLTARERGILRDIANGESLEQRAQAHSGAGEANQRIGTEKNQSRTNNKNQKQ